MKIESDGSDWELRNQNQSQRSMKRRIHCTLRPNGCKHRQKGIVKRETHTPRKSPEMPETIEKTPFLEASDIDL